MMHVEFEYLDELTCMSVAVSLEDLAAAAPTGGLIGDEPDINAEAVASLRLDGPLHLV